MTATEKDIIQNYINLALKEDIGDGDHTSLACVPDIAQGEAVLVAKEGGIIAGLEVAEMVFKTVDANIEFITLVKDGQRVQVGDEIFKVKGKSRSILTAERLSLNYIQRMSGIATSTNELVGLIKNSKTKLLDTRKTTPNCRIFEKMAVKLGGGENHRFGLYDMIMIKDNHADFAGGIKNAIEAVEDYLQKTGKYLAIEVEVRNFEELQIVLQKGGIKRIMLDNFSVEDLKKAVGIVGDRYETEASGGITKESLSDYASTNVDFISVGALTHHVASLDLSLKAI